MLVTRTRIALKSTTRGKDVEYIVDCNGVQITVVFRALVPVVQVAGVALQWEAHVCMPDGRTVDGYGSDRETAFAAAHEEATKDGVLDDALWRSVGRALAGSPDTSDEDNSKN